MIKRFLYILLICLCASVAIAQNYYVRPSGGSYGSENGTSYANAWDGFTNINWTTVDTGDGKLFIAGTHSETLTVGESGEDGNPIHIISCTTANGATNQDPGVITGTETITGWSVYSSSIYRSDVGNIDVFQVYDDDAIVLLAHDPNDGWHRADSAETTRYQLTDAGIAGTSVNGAFATVNPNGGIWLWSTYEISGLAGSVLSFTDDGRSDYSETWTTGSDKYFLTNHIDYLDQADEWFYDGSQYLYAWLSDSSDPDSSTTIAVERKYGIYASGRNWVTIEDLEIKYAGRAGIYINNSDNYVIDENNIHDCGSQIYYDDDRDRTGYGIIVIDSRPGTISDNTIDDAFLWGMRFEDADNTTVSGNTITDVGLVGINDYSPRGVGIGIQYNWDCSGGTISNNIIGNIGYDGIMIRDVKNVLNNYVYNACQFVADCGALQAWGTDTSGSVIEGNVIIGTGVDKDFDANGIYLDDGSTGIDLTDNTIIGPTRRAIFLHNSADCTLAGNKIYGTRQGIVLGTSSVPSSSHMNNNVIGTTQIALQNTGGPSEVNAIMWRDANSNGSLGSISNNYYSLYPSELVHTVFEYLGNWSTYDWYTLDEWQSERSRDSGTVLRTQQDGSGNDSSILYNTTGSSIQYTYSEVDTANGGSGYQYIYFDTQVVVEWPVTITAYDSEIILWDGNYENEAQLQKIKGIVPSGIKIN